MKFLTLFIKLKVLTVLNYLYTKARKCRYYFSDVVPYKESPFFWEVRHIDRQLLEITQEPLNTWDEDNWVDNTDHWLTPKTKELLDKLRKEEAM